MSQTLEKQITNRLKRIHCQQSDCRNNKEDNIDLIVFGNPDAKRTGLMCSQCLMDSQLLQQIKPVEQHSISIKKFMKTLTQKYQEYSQQKNSVNWGPNILQNQRAQIKEILSNYEQILFKGTLQIIKFVQDLQTQSLEQIKHLHKDVNFDKLTQLLAQEDQDQQQKINVSIQLRNITSMIMSSQGQYKLSNESQQKQKNDEIVKKYRKGIIYARQCFEKLIQNQKKLLKQLSIIDFKKDQ